MADPKLASSWSSHQDPPAGATKTSRCLVQKMPLRSTDALQHQESTAKASSLSVEACVKLGKNATNLPLTTRPARGSQVAQSPAAQLEPHGDIPARAC